jgi:hypothetical protein
MAALATDAVRTLTSIAEALEGVRDDWWLIGGSAVALHGLAIDIAGRWACASCSVARRADRYLRLFGRPKDLERARRLAEMA